MTTELSTERASAQFTPTGLLIPEGMTFEQWEEIGNSLAGIEQARQWWVGDWVNYGEARYGEKYTQALDATGLAYQTLMNAASVARKVEISRRRENLSWSHHEAVAKLDPAEQDRWLDRAASERLTRAEVRAALKPGDEADEDELVAFVTTLRILHPAKDTKSADAWARRLMARLTEQGATVTKHDTKPAH